LEISRPHSFISGNTHHSNEKGKYLGFCSFVEGIVMYSISIMFVLKNLGTYPIMILKVMTNYETCIIKLFTLFGGRK
jgi:hypothetical protein